MAGQNAEEKVEVKEEVECALNPKRSQYLRKSGRGEEVVGSTTPDASVTAPHRVHLLEGNQCACHGGSWEEPIGCVADACQSTPHDDLGSYYDGSKVQATRRYAVTLCQWQRRGFKTRNGPSSEEPGAS
jgi:hypothetical protein